MAAKYDRWHRIRLSGDQDKAKEHISEARKLLGYVAEQQKLSGVPQAPIRRVLQDGTIITAQMVRGQPMIEISSPPPGSPPPAEETLGGFVVSPGGTAEGFTEVLLQPAGKGDRWRVSFFSEDEVPVDYDAKHFFYSKAGTKSLLDAPDGLKHMGNVDWRNHDETLSVSWDGPQTRYFFDVTDYGSVVYYKGAPLFDSEEYRAALFGSSLGEWSEVRGACLVRRNGLTLLVMLRRKRSGSEHDTLLSVPLRVATGYSVPRGGIEQVARLELAVDPAAPEDDIQILFDQTSLNATDFRHPWLFNSSGREARCLRFEAGVAIHEWTLVLEDDFSAATLETNSEAWPVQVTTTVTTLTTAPVFVSGTTDVASDDGSLSGSKTLAGLRMYGVNSSADLEYENDQVVAFDTATTVETSRMRVAVDYRDDVPVYAFYTGENSTSAAHGESLRSSSYVSTIDGYTTSGFDGTGAGPYLKTYATSGSNDEHSEWSRTSSSDGTEYTFETDWITLTRATSGSVVEAGLATLDESWSTSDDLGAFPTAPSWRLFSCNNTGTGSGTLTIGVTRDVVEATAALGFNNLVFLDLRSRWLVYSETDQLDGVHTETTPRPYSGSATWSGASDPWAYGPTTDVAVLATGNPIDYDEIEIGDNTQTTTTSTVERLRVRLGDNELLNLETYRYEPSAGVSTFAETTRNRHAGGMALLYGTFGSDRHVGRTPEEFIVLTPLAETVGDETTTSASAAELAFSQFATIEGAWKTYRNKFCYSLKQQMAHGATYEYHHGIGNSGTGLPSAFTIPQLTGYPDTPPIFYPITILPPTSR